MARSQSLSRPLRLTTPQAHLLSLLDALDGEAGNLDFQKLLFLYCQANANPPYQFVPYRFGAFSFTSYADRRKLAERGCLADDDRTWRLTAAGRDLLGGLSLDRRPGRAIARRYRGVRGDALVAATYRAYPYHATRSEIAARVLRGDSAALEAVARARPGPNTASLLTIGYEGRGLEEYLNALLGAGASVLCDVRRNALSRKYGFSKSTLATACHGVGIRYEHLPELGIASEQRQALSSPAAYRDLFRAYRSSALPAQGPALARIQAWIAAGDRVALTCFEREAGMCHRYCVAEALEERAGAHLAPVNL